MTDNEKLIEEARKWNPAECAGSPTNASRAINHLADALEDTEKAHTPTDDEVNALTKQFADRIFAAGLRSPESTTAVIVFKEIAAGFRRSEVPEPSAEPTCEHGTPLSALCEYAAQYASGETDGPHPEHPEPQGEPSGIPFYGQKMRELAEVRAQGEPSDAQVDAALLRFSERRDETWWDAMRAALRAAEGVR